MSEPVTLLPLPKDIKIGAGAAFIKARGGALRWTDPNADLIAWMTCRRGGAGAGLAAEWAGAPVLMVGLAPPRARNGGQ